MSRVTDNWQRMRAKFQATTGFTPLLTIGAVSNKEVITGAPGFDFTTNWGGLTNSTTMEVQALSSDFPTNPTKGATATLTNTADGTITRQVLSVTRRDGICYFTLGDTSAGG